MPGNPENLHGLTPLMAACLSMDCDPEDIRSLIAAGADVNAATADGFTALHAAAMSDCSEDDCGCMMALLEAGADKEARANTQAGRGWTPLMLAAAEGYAAQVRMLLRWGADVNAVDLDGRTPLILAAGQGFETEAKIRFLLEAGADAQIKCRDGKTALDYARVYGRSLKEANRAEIAGIETVSFTVANIQAMIAKDWDRLVQETGIESTNLSLPGAESIIDFRRETSKALETWDRVIMLLGGAT